MMRWTGVLLCCGGVLLSLLITINGIVVSFSRVAGAPDEVVEDSLEASIDSSRFWNGFGVLLFLTGLAVLFVHWRMSRGIVSNDDDPVDSR